MVSRSPHQKSLEFPGDKREEQIERLSVLSGMLAIDYAVDIGITTHEEERRLWREHRSALRDSGEPQAGPSWDYGSSRHRQFIEEYRRPAFLDALRPKDSSVVEGVRHENLGLMRRIFEQEWKNKKKG